MRTLWLKKNEERRLKAGHLWIFSNEVDTKKSPLTDFAPGDEVLVSAASGALLGTASINPKTLICARLHSRLPYVRLDGDLLKKRLTSALALRSHLFDKPWYRLCHGEGDQMPGLVIDRYDRHLTVQISTVALEMRKELLTEVLHSLLGPQSILFDNNRAIRALEGLSESNDLLGDVPETLTLPENDCLFTIPIQKGQKTGWFFDQRDNRRRVAEMSRDKSVLDVFCYAGGFGVTAARHGAKSVTCIDASSEALRLAEKNLEANAKGIAADFLAGDAFEKLEELAAQGRQYDLVSLDPPAFIKRRKDVQTGVAAYRKLHELALNVLKPAGLLASSSCSYHLTAETHRDCLLRACRKKKAWLQILAVGGQAPDHPELLGMPETRYLKCLLGRVLFDKA